MTRRMLGGVNHVDGMEEMSCYGHSRNLMLNGLPPEDCQPITSTMHARSKATTRECVLCARSKSTARQPMVKIEQSQSRQGEQCLHRDPPKQRTTCRPMSIRQYIPPLASSVPPMQRCRQPFTCTYSSFAGLKPLVDREAPTRYIDGMRGLSAVMADFSIISVEALELTGPSEALLM